jgi:hypothetical protein
MKLANLSFVIITFLLSCNSHRTSNQLSFRSKLIGRTYRQEPLGHSKAINNLDPSLIEAEEIGGAVIYGNPTLLTTRVIIGDQTLVLIENCDEYCNNTKILDVLQIPTPQHPLYFSDSYCSGPIEPLRPLIAVVDRDKEWQNKLGMHPAVYAWAIDTTTGKIESVRADGVSCEIIESYDY